MRTLLMLLTLSLSVMARAENFQLQLAAEPPVQERCDVRIDFTPRFEGFHTGNVLIDLYDQRFIIDLWGQGIPR